MAYLACFLVAVIALLLTIFFRYRLKQMRLFEIMDICGPKPNLLFGNLLELGKGGMHKTIQKWSRKFGTTFGYFEGPVPILVTADVDLLREVFIKQFHNFNGRKHLPLQPDPDTGKTVGMFVAEGERWKRQRATINPAFSASRMKKLLPVINDCTSALLESLEKKCKENNSFNIYELYQSLTLDCIIGCSFGLKLDSLRRPEDPILKEFRKFFQMFKEISPLLLLAIMTPELNKDVWANIYDVMMNVFQNSQKWLHDLALGIISIRKDEDTMKRTDFLQCMLDARDRLFRTENSKHEANHEKSGKQKILSDNEIQAQCATLLAAGYETSSTTLAYITYELALNPEIQDTLISEIDDLIEEGEAVDYDSVKKLEYMDRCIKETIRLHPIAPIAVNRRCQSDCKIAGYNIPKDMVIHANVFALHNDPEMWGPEDTSSFCPERFTPENIAKRHPMAWMGFGAGPKNCIGMRFALMEVKVVLTRILQKYKFVQTEQTNVPLETVEMATITPKHGVSVKLVERKQ